MEKSTCCFGCIKINRNSLKNWHFRAALAHFIMAFAVLGIAIWKGQGMCVPITISYNGARPGANANTSSVEQIGGPGICFAFMAFAFELVCFAAHARILWIWETYIQYILTKRVNPWRWAEYALSSSIMIMAVASVSGSHSLGELLGYVGCNVGCMATGYWSETKNKRKKEKEEEAEEEATTSLYVKTIQKTKQKKRVYPSSAGAEEKPSDDDSKKGPRWLPFLVGTALEIFVWIGIFTSYGVTVNKVNTDVPWFVHLFVAQLFLFFNLFAVVEFLWIIGYIESYEIKEFCYVMLSLQSKISLSALVAGAAF